MFEMILVPVDESELSCHAVPYAKSLLRPTGRLILMRAAEGHTFPGGDSAAGQVEAVHEAEEATSNLCQGLLNEGTAAEWHVYYGPPGKAICEEAEIVEADLIVMSTHARSELGKMVLSSVAKKVVQKAPVPVLLVSPKCHEPWPRAAGQHIVVPMERSQLSEAAIEPAIELGQALSAGLLLVGFLQSAYAGYGQAIYPPFELNDELQALNGYLQEIVAKVRMRGLACSVAVDIAEPAGAIVQTANRQNVAAIVMATHGRSGLARLALGSVAAAVVHSASVPVLLVRPAATQAAEAPVLALASSAG